MNTKKLTLTAMFLALGFVLPMLTGQVPQIGAMLLPMHIPIFLCAFVCGSQYALPIGVMLPILRSVIFSRPNFYPEAIAIAAELAAYAAVSGILYHKTFKKGLKSVYISLIVAMLVGRAVRGLVQLVLLSLQNNLFTAKAFFVGIVAAGIPGIILQLILIPAVLSLNMLKKIER